MSTSTSIRSTPSATGNADQLSQHHMDLKTEDTQSITSFDVNREILKEVAKIYNPPEISALASTTTGNGKKQRALHRRSLSSSFDGLQEPIFPIGLRRIGQLVNQHVSMSHHKAAIMVIGNISAGKSTFINWYVQEAVQKTGMAIETSGFTYITSGRIVTEIGGESTLALRPQLQKLVTKYKGLLENLSLKTCPSRDGRLHLVDLIDTPGLADGELQYPFDVDEVIFEMRHYVDLFFVFFDPIGQALGKRVLDIVKRLNTTCPDRVRFVLTKIDEVRTEEERIKVMCQTTQSLTTKINSKHGFDLVPIYIPGAKEGTYLSMPSEKVSKTNSCVVNRLNDLVQDIDRITERRVQDSLNTLLSDIDRLAIAVNREVQAYGAIKQRIALQDSKARRHIITRLVVFFVAICLGMFHFKAYPNIFPPITRIIDNLASSIEPKGVRYLNIGANALLSVPYVFVILWSIIGLLFLSTVSFKSTPKPSLNNHNEYTKFLECKEFLNLARHRWKQLNRLYIDHAMNDSGESSTFEI